MAPPALLVRNFRLFAAAQTVSLTGTWMQRIAQDWLVLDLAHNDGRALGIVTAAQFIPYALLTLPGGAVADRFPKRSLLIGTQSIMGTLALALALLDAAHAVELWQVYALALGLGIVSAVDSPIRQSFWVELVGPSLLSSAVSINSATFNAGRLIGPVLAGIVIGGRHTEWPVFAINAASFAATVVALLRMRADEIISVQRAPDAPVSIRAALRNARSDPGLLLPLILVGTAATLGLNTLPIFVGIMARTEFHSSATAFGLLSAVLAIGSLFGALFGARRDRPSTRLLTRSALALGGLEALASSVPDYTLFAVVLAFIGLATYLVITMANSCVQLAAPPGMRGRTMAIYLLVFFAPTPLSSLVVGVGTASIGVRWTMFTAGILGTLVTTVAIAGFSADKSIFGLIRKPPRASSPPATESLTD